jgi:hypothetical protein
MREKGGKEEAMWLSSSNMLEMVTGANFVLHNWQTKLARANPFP